MRKNSPNRRRTASEQTEQSTPTRAVHWSRVGAFLALAYGLAWMLALPSIRAGADLSDPLGSPSAHAATVAMMFTPGLAALVVSVILERRRGRVLLGGLGLIGFFRRRSWRFAGIGVAGAALLVAGNWGIGLLLGWLQLDPERSFVKDLIVDVTGEQPPLPMTLLALLQLLNLPLGLAITAIAATGEEIGWRGWLLPRLLPLGRTSALATSGAIWGFWHAPAILLGLNYDQRNPVGILMMLVGCVGAGVLIGWLRLASESLLPCVLAHAALNSFATFESVLFPPFDHKLVGPLAMSGWIVMALIIACALWRANRSRQLHSSEER